MCMCRGGVCPVLSRHGHHSYAAEVVPLSRAQTGNQNTPRPSPAAPENQVPLGYNNLAKNRYFSTEVRKILSPNFILDPLWVYQSKLKSRGELFHTTATLYAIHKGQPCCHLLLLQCRTYGCYRVDLINSFFFSISRCRNIPFKMQSFSFANQERSCM